MMDPTRVQILGLGACTPIGRNVWASAAAVRAGLSGFCEHPFMADTAGEPMRVAYSPWLAATLGITDRCRELLLSAIGEVLAAVQEPQSLDGARIGFALALPPVRPGRPPDLAHVMADAVAAKFGRRLPEPVAFEHGHAAWYAGLDVAVRSLVATAADAYLVAGVDSYLAPETLEWVEASDQLHGAGPLNNAWGFIPGEAAAAVLLTTASFARWLRTDTLGEVVGVGLGRETRVIKTDGVCTGEGLTQAFRLALAPLPRGEQVQNVFCDLNGEPYRADEYGFTALRLKDRFRAATDFVAPADCWGDIGAASAPLHVALAIISHRKRYAYGPVSMAWASSESGERGAAVVSAVAPEGR